MVDGLFGFEVWRQHRDDLLREAEQARMARTARGWKRHAFSRGLLRALSSIFVGQASMENEYGVASSSRANGEVHRIPGRGRRCKSKAA